MVSQVEYKRKFLVVVEDRRAHLWVVVCEAQALDDFVDFQYWGGGYELVTSPNQGVRYE